MWQSWVNGFIGIWLLISPWVISSTTTNSVIFGIIVGILGFWGAAQTSQFGNKQ